MPKSAATWAIGPHESIPVSQKLPFVVKKLYTSWLWRDNDNLVVFSTLIRTRLASCESRLEAVELTL